jgi:hypothetical protein
VATSTSTGVIVAGLALTMFSLKTALLAVTAMMMLAAAKVAWSLRRRLT